MVNATTNETFPQLFAFPQLIDPYNPPRIVRRDAEGNEIEEDPEDEQVWGQCTPPHSFCNAELVGQQSKV